MKVCIVSSICLLAVLTGACHSATSQPGDLGGRGNHPIPESAISKAYGAPKQIAELEDGAVDESSGVVASRRNPGLFWTHNDSGDGPFLYAFDLNGTKRGTWRVTGARALDWEDIAASPGAGGVETSYLYVGDIGDNSKKREEIVVYRVAEPVVTATDADTDRNEPQQTEPAEAIHLRYPDGAHDAEALAVHPATGDLYIITKTRGSTPSGVYKLAAPFSTSNINTLQRVSSLSTPGLYPGMITGADISPDGRKIILCDYFNAYELGLPGSKGDKFDDIWKQSIAIVGLGAREQGEAICYRLDGQAILATSEGSPAALVEVDAIKR
jgi:hypothetical protein